MLRRWSSKKFENGLAHGRQGRVWRRSVDSFFPPRCFKAAILEESVGDHCHERMTMQALPESAFEVIETVFFFQLLVRLLATAKRALRLPFVPARRLRARHLAFASMSSAGIDRLSGMCR
jgi:hypothetical protein